jgi:hypothetical protein
MSEKRLILVVKCQTVVGASQVLFFLLSVIPTDPFASKPL